IYGTDLKKLFVKHSVVYFILKPTFQFPQELCVTHFSTPSSFSFLDNDLHLGDALDGGDIPRKPLYPPLPPRPGSHSNSGGFDDSDLFDGKILPPHIAGEDEHHFNQGANTDSGLIAGVTSPIISAFVILVVGSIAAYSAYKNKKLCFKPYAGDTV
uniref:C99L2 protein n=1 Tax=Accipiter nisus TaxID=211598 RepID=A0A8B9P0V3_9AVES